MHINRLFDVFKAGVMSLGSELLDENYAEAERIVDAALSRLERLRNRVKEERRMAERLADQVARETQQFCSVCEQWRTAADFVREDVRCKACRSVVRRVRSLAETRGRGV